MEFIIVALFVFVGIILVQVYLYYDRKKQRTNYPILWQEFETCIKFKIYNGILSTGNKLVFNKYLSQEHLTIIFKTATELELKLPEFKELRLNAYNKQLHYNRTFPGVGSSGEIKQTWSDEK